MKISVVTTMYYSAPYIKGFYERIIKTIKEIPDFDDYEIIFVNDGSPDNSLEIALELFKNDYHVKVIDLSRNFGHHKAIMTGLSYTTGDFIFLIDCDLEERPELLIKFWEEIKEAIDVDVIYGVQEKRKGNWFEKISGEIFYKIFNYLSETQITPNLVTCRLMKARYVRELISFKEQEIYLPGIWVITGFNQRPLLINKLSSNSTTYTLSKKIALLINSITSFSNKPLLYIFNLGFFITSFSFTYVVYIFIKKLFFGINISGWTSITISLWLLGGVIIFCIGVLGIYLSKVFNESKNRPFTIIKSVYQREQKNEICNFCQW